jgi:hypothetical protein
VLSVWESNGGLALEIAAAAVDPAGVAPADATWQAARFVGQPITTLPVTIVFEGSGIALIGTIGEACGRGHVRVFIDGVETFDRTGFWQNPSMPGGDSVLFAWRWLKPATHTIQLEPGDAAQIGASVMHLGSLVLATTSTDGTVGFTR